MANQATAEDLINMRITAAMAAAVPPVPAAALIPPAAAPAPYAFMPRAANPNVLDFNQTDALKLFNKVITALDTEFNLAEDNLRKFLEQIRERTRIFNWENLLTVNDSVGTARNLINNGGMYTMDDCRTHATTHLSLQNRMTQDSMMCK
jgi:hypothetical protein